MMRNDSTRGFIFLAVLVFLNLFSAMSLSALSHAVITLKINQHDWQREREVSSAHAMLRQLEKKVLASSKPFCRIAMTSIRLLVRQPETWWQQNACRGEQLGMRYYYMIESLGNDPCAYIIMPIKKQFYMPAYFRITLLALSAKMSYASMLLQSTVAKPTKELPTCSSKIHSVSLGRQMWREM